jgi:hypothetical protein
VSDDLTAFLRARLDEDENKIRFMEREEHRVQTAPIFQGHPPDWLAGVDIFVSSKRWRAEVEAKRRVLDLHAPVIDGSQGSWAWFEGSESMSEQIVRLLALPYADHADYRPEWRPAE